jgi:hypothetical protein
MNLSCCIEVGDTFPPLELEFLGGEKGKLENQEGKYIVIRTWNLSESMINFENMVEQFQNNEKVQLVGLCRGSEKDLYESQIKMNGWDRWRHIFGGQVLDCEYDGVEVKGTSILSAMVVDPKGVVVL